MGRKLPRACVLFALCLATAGSAAAPLSVIGAEAPTPAVPTTRNLLANSSFESGIPPGPHPPGWTFYYDVKKFGQKIEICETHPWDGKYCVHMYTTNPAAEAYNFQLNSKAVPYNPAKKYVASCYVKGRIAFLSIQYLPEKGDLIDVEYLNVGQDLGSEWRRLILPGGKARPNAARMCVVVRVESPGNEAFVDAVQLEEGVEATEYVPSGDFPVPPKKQRKGQFFPE